MLFRRSEGRDASALDVEIGKGQALQHRNVVFAAVLDRVVRVHLFDPMTALTSIKGRATHGWLLAKCPSQVRHFRRERGRRRPLWRLGNFALAQSGL